MPENFPVELEVRPSQIRASAAEAALMIPGAAALAKHPSELSLPVAIMAGRGDKIVDCDSQAGRLEKVSAGCKLVLVPATGHMIHYGVPEQVVAVIRKVVQDGLSNSDPRGPISRHGRLGRKAPKARPRTH